MKPTMLRLLVKILPGVLGVGAMVLLLLWLTGAFHDSIPLQGPQETRRLAQGERVVEVERKPYPLTESAVGTIRPVAETQVGSKILARVVHMRIERAGQRVRQNEVLVELDDSDLVARLEEAKAALRSAQAASEQAQSDLKRSSELFEQQLLSQEDLDRQRTRVRTAQAEVERAEQHVASAKTALSYATIRAPYEGTVVDKLVNEGDLVSPGQVLFAMYDPLRLQLIAPVRETLAASLEIGQSVRVHIAAIDKICEGRIDQIVPEAQRGSRSFEVKVSGPCSPEVMTGMFGRMTVAVGTRDQLRIPKTAVRSIGQLQMVFLVDDEGHVMRRFVQLGTEFDEDVQVLAGLIGGERILAVASEQG